MSSLTRVSVESLAGRAPAGAEECVHVQKKHGKAPFVFDQVTDRIIHVAGSAPLLATAGLFELGWLAAGKPANFSNGWQLAMSDVSTIAVFWMNPVLQNAENRHAQGQQVRFAQGADLCRQFATAVRTDLAPTAQGPVAAPVAMAASQRSWFDRAVRWTSTKVGHPGFFIGALFGVGAWTGLGAPMHWSNAWQLIVNSATSAFELPAALALHNTKLRDDAELEGLLNAEIAGIQADAKAFGYGDLVPRAGAPAAHAGLVTRGIYGVARMEGSAVAMAVQVGLVLAWPGLGAPMHWDDNWQLALGTPTSIASYLFLLVLLFTHHRHIEQMEVSSTSMVAYSEAALRQVHPSRAALERGTLCRSRAPCGLADALHLGLSPRRVVVDRRGGGVLRHPSMGCDPRIFGYHHLDVGDQFRDHGGANLVVYPDHGCALPCFGHDTALSGLPRDIARCAGVKP